jgi:hypothetical protein
MKNSQSTGTQSVSDDFGALLESIQTKTSSRIE